MIDKAELNNTAGHCQVMNTINTEGAPRERFSWSSIGYAQPSPQLIIAVPSQQLPAGFYMDCWKSNRAYPVFRAIIPSRLYTLATDPDSMEESERIELRKFFIYDSSTSRARLPDIALLSTFMSVPAMASTAFMAVFPCKTNFIMNDKNGNRIDQQCTNQVWCENCSTIAKALGAAWNVSTTSRHLAQLLATFATFCDFPEDITDIILEEETFHYKNPHVCTNNCPKNRTAL